VAPHLDHGGVVAHPHLDARRLARKEPAEAGHEPVLGKRSLPWVARSHDDPPYQRLEEVCMPVINTIELEGVSDKSWGDAAREALKEASKTIRHINKMEVLGTSNGVRDNSIVEYRTSVRLFFEVEGSGGKR
jgi:flavin-binding protein dodecin